MPNKIPLEPISSSAMDAVGYDEPTLTLAIRFNSGEIWHYPGVRPELLQQFALAESKGRFYAQHIKGKFTGAEPMTGACAACGDRGWIGDTCVDCGTQRYERAPRPMRGTET